MSQPVSAPAFSPTIVHSQTKWRQITTDQKMYYLVVAHLRRLKQYRRAGCTSKLWDILHSVSSIILLAGLLLFWFTGILIYIVSVNTPECVCDIGAQEVKYKLTYMDPVNWQLGAVAVFLLISASKCFKLPIKMVLQRSCGALIVLFGTIALVIGAWEISEGLCSTCAHKLFIFWVVIFFSWGLACVVAWADCKSPPNQRSLLICWEAFEEEHTLPTTVMVPSVDSEQTQVVKAGVLFSIEDDSEEEGDLGVEHKGAQSTLGNAQPTTNGTVEL